MIRTVFVGEGIIHVLQKRLLFRQSGHCWERRMGREEHTE